MAKGNRSERYHLTNTNQTTKGKYKIYLLLFCLHFLVFVNCYCNDSEVISFVAHAKVANQKLTVTYSYVIQINNRRGEDLTNIKIHFSKKEKIQNLEGWIEDAYGKIIRKLKKQSIVDVSAVTSYTLYQDDFIRKFELRHNEYPYRVCYTYQQCYDEFLEIADWQPVIDTDSPTIDAELILETPVNYPVHIFEREVKLVSSDTTQGNVIRRWKSSYTTQIKHEKMAPPFEELFPTVKIVPLEFYYGIQGSAATWETFGNWQYSLNEGLDVLPETEKQNIDRLIKGVSDKREITKKIYHYLQERTHYVNVVIGIGGLKPYTAEYVAVNKYGDCKALTNYMQSLLKYAGISSYYTIVLAGENKAAIIKQLPAPQFNHVILTVPFGKDTVWLDCTSHTAPFGYLGTFSQNRYGLLVDKLNSKLIKLPALNKGDVLESHKSKINIDLDGNASVDYEIKAGGHNFELFKEIKNEYNTSQQDLILRDIITINNAVINHWEIKNPHQDSAYTGLSLNVKITNFSKKITDYFIFNLIPLDIPKFEQPTYRTLPVRVNYPVCLIDTTYLTSPPGYNFSGNPKPVNITSEFGSYVQQNILEKNILIAIRRFELNSGEFPIEKYNSFFKFYKSIEDAENTKLTLKKL
jgi:hypothetical protein